MRGKDASAGCFQSAQERAATTEGGGRQADEHLSTPAHGSRRDSRSGSQLKGHLSWGFMLSWSARGKASRAGEWQGQRERLPRSKGFCDASAPLGSATDPRRAG